jgi:1,2-phenylacetyl-CoA epoxidase PaaB subunit
MARKMIERVYKVSTPNRMGLEFSWKTAGFILATTAEMALFEAKDSFTETALAVEHASEKETKEFFA